MSSIKVSGNRWTIARFSLPLGACLVAGLMMSTAQAQTAATDPFAPDAVAPQEPTSNPTAPKPVAPVLPPRIKAMPATPVETGTSLPVPTAVPSAPAPTAVTPLTVPTQAPSATQAPTTNLNTQVRPLSDIEKLQRLQDTVGQQTQPPSATPFEQSSLAPTQPVAAPKVTQVATPTAPEPTLRRALPKPSLPPKEGPEIASDVPVVQSVSETKTASVKPQESLLGNIGNFLGNMFSRDKEDEPVKTAKVSDAPSQTPSGAAETHPKKAQKQSEPDHPAPAPVVTIDPRLTNAIFALGSDIRLGQSLSNLSKEAQCFTKKRGIVTYCVAPTKWTSPLARHFDVSSHLYKGERVIVQFDGEIATRLYALFNADGFEETVRYFEEKFGPATHHFSRTTRTLKKDVDNPTYIWRKENETEGLTEIFEIRKIADTRGSLPDVDRGSIRVYFEGARSIFSLSSDIDFMELHY